LNSVLEEEVYVRQPPGFESEKYPHLWCPRFLISAINANARISEVKPTEIGQTMVNLGHHLENLANNP
jgi:hypothetical protein